jgi:hypothetical protein
MADEDGEGAGGDRKLTTNIESGNEAGAGAGAGMGTGMSGGMNVGASGTSPRAGQAGVGQAGASGSGLGRIGGAIDDDRQGAGMGAGYAGGDGGDPRETGQRRSIISSIRHSLFGSRGGKDGQPNSSALSDSHKGGR